MLIILNIRIVIASGKSVERYGLGNRGAYKGICNNLFLKVVGNTYSQTVQNILVYILYIYLYI